MRRALYLSLFVLRVGVRFWTALIVARTGRECPRNYQMTKSDKRQMKCELQLRMN